jgi:ribosomal-protein-alanine N-acetyltransferase
MFSLVSIDSVDVLKIFILSDYRRRGFGKELLTEIIKSYAMKPVYLEVDESNEVAINFYKAIGFVRIHMRRNYYDYQKNAIIMVKEPE